MTGAAFRRYLGEVRTGSQNCRRTALPAALIAVAFTVGTSWAQPADRLSVVVSLHPWADIVAQVGGEAVSVTTLLPAGASPHAFEPLPSQGALLHVADLVVINGGLDGWLERLLRAVAPSATQLVIMESVAFEPLHEHAHGSAEEAHGAQGSNPHVWLDPDVAAEAASVIAEALAELRPGLGDTFRANAAELAAELEALAAELEALLAPAQGAPFVQFHDAWGYFARRFGLDVVATLEPFPGREPSSRYVAETVFVVRRSGAKAIFDERQLSGRTAEVVAESAGVEVVMLDPIGGPPGPSTYQELLRHNARLIADALGPR